MASRSQTRPADQCAPSQCATAQCAVQRAPVQRAPVQHAPVKPEEEIIDIGNISPCSDDKDTPAPAPAKAQATRAGGVNAPDEEATCVAPILLNRLLRATGPSTSTYCLIVPKANRRYVNTASKYCYLILHLFTSNKL